jgi:hypothetical protein
MTRILASMPWRLVIVSISSGVFNLFRENLMCRRITLSLLLLVSQAALSACGGGSASATNNPPAPPPPVDTELDWDQGNWDQENWQ